MESIRPDVAAWESYGFSAESGERKSARELLVQHLARCAGRAGLPAGLKALTDYVSASHYFLVRHDVSPEAGLEAVVASDWPFDLVRNIASAIVVRQSRMSELDKHKEKTLIVVDSMGQQSGTICRELLKAGYNAAKLSGGVSSWKADNLPLVK